MAQISKNISKEVARLIEDKITQGAAYRARILSMVFGVGFTVFGFTSLPQIAQFRSDVTLWDNIWPRLLFNTLPFLFIIYKLKKWKQNALKVIWYWNIGFPLIFIAACNIYVWPTMYQGHTNLYLYVHGANIIVLLMAFILVAQPPKQMAVTVILLLLGFVIPIIGILIKARDMMTLNFIVGDFVYAFVLGLMAAYKNYQLRWTLAFEDLEKKKQVEKFVGSKVSDSVFDGTQLKPQIAESFFMVMDFRGFTQFIKQMDEEAKKNFMEEYYRIVTRSVSSHMGFVHKTAGDGFYISFGLMDSDVDLSDIPEIEKDERTAKNNKRKYLFEQSIQAFFEITESFEKLKQKYAVAQDLKIGAALDFGEIVCKVIGDPESKLEFDIDGVVVARCSRLENYTKHLISYYHLTKSVIAISEQAFSYSTHVGLYSKHLTAENPVRDFPELKYVFFRQSSLLMLPSIKKAA